MVNKKLVGLIFCSLVFFVDGSSMQPAKKKTGHVSPANFARITNWNSEYNQEVDRRVPKYATPGTDTSIGDPEHRPAVWKPARKPLFDYTFPMKDCTPSGHYADLLHRVDYTPSGLDYVAYDEDGNEVGPAPKGLQKNSGMSYYEPLSFDEMKAEHVLFASDVAALFGLEEAALVATEVALVQETLRNLLGYKTKFDVSEQEELIRRMNPREQVFQYKKLLELERSLRAFLHVIGAPKLSAMVTNPELHYFQLLVGFEYFLIQNKEPEDRETYTNY